MDLIQETIQLFANIAETFSEVVNIPIVTEYAGSVLTFIFVMPIVLGVYVLTRGSASGSKTWMFVTWSISVGFFTYVQLTEIWVGIVSIVFPLTIYIAYKVSKIIGGRD